MRMEGKAEHRVGGGTGNAGDGRSRDETVEEERKKYLRSRLGL